ncbi:MAG TPA: PAS domain-containing sensor histidine kinase [Candidatus Limnocylindrales bacterium]|nr:PAS domain-containing sensor histidine kinase [Candidatus Limnocylindrales bacterium]
MTPPTEDLLRLLAEQAREHAFILLDADGRILWWSPSAEEIFGASAEEMNGQPLSVLFVPEDNAMGLPDHELAVARSSGAAENDRWLQRKDGSRFWAAGATTPLKDRDGRIFAFGKILRNRTDQKGYIEALRKRAERLAREDEQKTVFLSTLSHELRNPLAPLTNAVHLLRLAAADIPNVEYPINLIERQVAFIHRLVDDLLDLTRIRAGKIDVKLEPVVLQTVLEKAVEDVAHDARERGHDLDLLLPSGPIIVDADPLRLHQIFVNLIGNAVKYTPDRGKIWVKATVEPLEAVVHVEDTGIGIAADMLPRIFDLFTQVESARDKSNGGLGIGLSLVKNLVTLHGGTIQVHSDGVGKGSEFTVRLPLPA